MIFDEDGKIVGRHRWRDRDRWLSPLGFVGVYLAVVTVIVVVLVWWLA